MHYIEGERVVTENGINDDLLDTSKRLRIICVRGVPIEPIRLTLYHVTQSMLVIGYTHIVHVNTVLLTFDT